MPGLFQGLELGKRALLGHQVSLQTISHNISNVDTPGYTRQRVGVSTSYPEISVHGPLGTGMQVDDISHVRDLFLGKQYRDAQKDFGRWTYIDKSMQQIEQIFSEPQDNSLNDALDAFWNDWSALATDAENSGHRTSIVADANRLINAFRHLSTSLEELRQATDTDLAGLTAEVNQKTGEIAHLNQQIKLQELDGSNANDLRDLRDRLTDELAEIIDVNTVEKKNGATMVYMGSMVLVDGSESFKIGAQAVTIGGKLRHQLVWEGSEVVLKNVNGQLAGLVETRDEVIPRYIDELNRLARNLVEQVNAIHVNGYGLDGSTGVAFFDPDFTDAANLRINQDILNNTNRIAASDSSNPEDRGNGNVAATMAALRNATVMSNGSATINQFYQGLVGKLGVEAREAGSFSSNYQLIAHQIDNQRQSVQGVSLDEEMANLVKAQHAFDAAARIITVMDDALEEVIHRMGVAG
jgi:flagellar hook-associated protein 1 FlgK